MRIVDGLERVSSQTPDDWAAVADAVVVGRVTSESQLPSARSETRAGMQTDLVGRSVDFDVSKTLWRSKDAKNVVPDSVRLQVSGWFVTGSTRVEATFSGSSRLEVGHSYVVALVWVEAQCDVDDGSTPAQWAVIGSGGAVPADDGVLGRGEVQGSPVYRVPADSVLRDGVLGQVAGTSPADVAPVLEKAGPVERRNFMAGTRNTC